MLQQRGGVRLDGRDSGNQRVGIGEMRAVLRNARAHAFLGKFGVELDAPGVFAEAVGVMRVVRVGKQRHRAGRQLQDAFTVPGINYIMISSNIFFSNRFSNNVCPPLVKIYLFSISRKRSKIINAFFYYFLYLRPIRQNLSIIK